MGKREGVRVRVTQAIVKTEVSIICILRQVFVCIRWGMGVVKVFVFIVLAQGNNFV